MKQLQLSRTVAYAVQATIQLAEGQTTGPTPCSKLASRGNMPERFLLQILRNLVTHGILRSTRGVDGGYSLTRRPDDISLLDVIEAIEGPMDAESAGNTEGMSSETTQRLQTALKQVAENARSQLSAIKLSQLVTASEAASEDSQAATAVPETSASALDT